MFSSQSFFVRARSNRILDTLCVCVCLFKTLSTICPKNHSCRVYASCSYITWNAQLCAHKMLKSACLARDRHTSGRTRVFAAATATAAACARKITHLALCSHYVLIDTPCIRAAFCICNVMVRLAGWPGWLWCLLNRIRLAVREHKRTAAPPDHK